MPAIDLCPQTRKSSSPVSLSTPTLYKSLWTMTCKNVALSHRTRWPPSSSGGVSVAKAITLKDKFDGGDLGWSLLYRHLPLHLFSGLHGRLLRKKIRDECRNEKNTTYREWYSCWQPHRSECFLSKIYGRREVARRTSHSSRNHCPNFRPRLPLVIPSAYNVMNTTTLHT